ncbi:MAG: hypothetical protein ACOYJL_06730 [Tractidigestivibacter sp.]|uniref:hypothetical protein n=1 Tax=Tractidigestivibacter sp. TaxID=2847320 RepID=UPI003D925547
MRKARGKGDPGEKPAKLKMSNTKFKVLLIIPMVIIALVAVLATVVTDVLSTTLDTYVGAGETYVETPDDRTDWDSTYYDTEVTTIERGE